MKKYIFLFIVLILSQYFCYSQKQGQEKIDSLFSVLSTAKEDITKVKTLDELASEFRYSNLDTALYFTNRELALATKLNYEMGIANAKLMLGAICASSGKYVEGIQFCNEALILYEKLLSSANASDKENILAKKGRTYTIIGHNRISQGNYAEGLENSFLALKIREEIGDRRGVFHTEFNIGIIYDHQHNYTDALKHYTICLELSKELGDKADIANILGAIGYVYFEQSNYQEAEKNYLAALKLAEETQDKYALSELYNSLGIMSDKQGNYSQALKYNFAALKLNEGSGINEQNPLIYNNIALVYMKQKRHNDASEFMDRAISLAKGIGHLEYIKLSYQNRATLDSAQGNYKMALEHYKMYITYRDSLINDGNTKKIVQQQMQYDFDKIESLTKAEQEKKDAIAQKELQKQKLVRNGFIGGFAIVLSFAGIFFSQKNKIEKGKERSDELLLNILPSEVAEELKAKGSADARQFDEVTVMFTDFKGFTQISEKLSPTELVHEIHTCFEAFDNIIGKHNIEKIKTIGDAYMCAGGLPIANTTNATDVVNAALEIQKFMKDQLHQRKIEGKEVFEIRIGIHTGPVVAGIVGVKKFAYDIWGDTVNIASRMESSSEAGKVNISGSTYLLVRDKFACTHRGKIQAKNKGEIDMYFVETVS